jgi:hypothetical protein
MYHNHDQTLFFAAAPLLSSGGSGGGANVMDVLAVALPGLTRDALLLHLGALVWNKCFASVEDLLVNGVWCPTLSFKKLRAHPAIASILGDDACDGSETTCVRVIMEWITRNHEGEPTDERDVLVMLWICASLFRIRIIVWEHSGPTAGAGAAAVTGNRVIRERVRVTPKMPDGPSGLAAFAAWDETATTIHLLHQSTIEWLRLEPSRSEPLCELRRYDNATYTNIVIAPFVAQCPVVHTCSLALDQLVEGAYIYQVYLCRHEKRTWPSHIYQAATGLYVYRSAFPLRSPGPTGPLYRWVYCAMVRLDSSTWPYFLIPYDTTRCVCAVFASSTAEAERLLEQWA